MYLYTAFGLSLDSALPIPEFSSRSEGCPDVVVQLADRQEQQAYVPVQRTRIIALDQLVQFAWPGVGSYRVRHGRNVVICPETDNTQLVRQPLLGIVLATVLHQRRLLPLHASALNLAGGAVAFLGEKGAGKSTVAAAFLAAGYPVMADDVLAIDVSMPQCPLAAPAFPQLKLWPDTAIAVGVRPADLPRLSAQHEKRLCAIPANFWSRPVPLQQFYVLERGETLRCTPLRPSEAVAALIAHSYVARIIPQLFEGKQAIEHLVRCVALAKCVAAFRLEYPRSFHCLPEVVRLVEQNLEGAPAYPVGRRVQVG
jgi:hypothetical protein